MAPSAAPRNIDWPAFVAALGEIPILTHPEEIARRSVDFYWYSPVLNEALAHCRGDLVVCPRNEAEVMRVAAACAKARVPLTVRGAGTGNYGQCVPLAGGVILDVTQMNRVLSIAPGRARVEAGCVLFELDEQARKTGQQLLMYPSTGRVATVGGFIAGGHSGIGSIRHGILADPGNVSLIRVVTLEETPRVIELTGADIMQVHHAYGTNGVITELEVALTPAVDWVHCIAAFPSYADVLRFGIAAGGRCVARDPSMDLFLLSAVERRIMPYYEALADRVQSRDCMFALVAPQSIDAFFALAAEHGGAKVLAETPEALEAKHLPLAIECAYNHTTLTALKTDRTVTYLQVAFPAPLSVALVEEFMEEFGDELYMHHEFSKMHGQLVSFALPLVRYFDRDRLYEIIRVFESKGCIVFDPHTYVLEDGGMKVIDQAQVAFKRRADPLGLMNPGKTRGEAQVP